MAGDLIVGPGGALPGGGVPPRLEVASVRYELALVRTLLELALAQNGALRLRPGDLEPLKRPADSIGSGRSTVPDRGDSLVVYRPGFGISWANVPAAVPAEREALAEVLRALAGNDSIASQGDLPVMLERAAQLLEQVKEGAGIGPAGAPDEAPAPEKKRRRMAFKRARP